MYRQRHELAIDPRDWRNALILFALPYALTTRRVVVVCPETFRIGTEVRREAKRRKIALFTLPLDALSGGQDRTDPPAIVRHGRAGR